ncbi:extended synaptotagmin-2-like isoform X1 [Penaeus chinensis]|uniref:extended synaptotagmin-2-like isoform X1 n=2 Tax=Penaeus chinensis TaxID=139456 RepID=UPI001FB71738|nr:extended synaptotagmin-2-like isoform X1 [Penaeus chinensis]XP_047484095.1 extended synaptotagmin-2-like isoform X1 [Penaeus chinensis]
MQMVWSRLWCALRSCLLGISDSVSGKVTFPGMESAGWLNILIRQLWPSAEQYVNELCRTTIEPVLRSALEDYKLKSFRFEEITLGQTPPKLTGVKVYDDQALAEIVMDLDFEYIGDCKIRASVSELTFGIEDLQLTGRLRIVMKPLVKDPPLVGGVHVLFLSKPELSYNFTGTANVLDLPVVKRLFHRAVEEQIEELMVMPNKLPIQILNSIDVADFMCPVPSGVVRLHIIEAENLAKKDFGILDTSKPDPYCIMRIGLQNFKTETLRNTLNPKWDACKEYVCSSDTRFGNKIHFEIFDHDRLTDDDFLFKTHLEFQEIWKREIDTWLPPTETNNSGRLHIKATWYDLSDSADSLQIQLEEMCALQLPTKKPLHSALLVVWVDAAKNLVSRHRIRKKGEPDTFVRVRLDDVKKKSTVRERTNNPVYREGFVFLVRNPWTQKLMLEVIGRKHERQLGKVEVDLNSVLNEPKLEVRGKEFELQGDAEETATLKLNIILRILRKAVAENNESIATE